MNRLRTLASGFYAWIVSISFGIILLDILYAHILKEAVSTNIPQALFTGAADLFLWINGIAILAAIGAIVFSWNLSLARNLFIASLLIVILELIFPVFISLIVKNVENLTIGPWIRIILSGSASLCALVGLVAGVNH